MATTTPPPHDTVVETVVDDDDNDSVSMLLSAADQARAAAAERRQRILNGSKSRMAIVSGQGGGSKDTTDPTTNSSSNSKAKMAALRRRRFKSSKSSSTTTPTTGAAASEATAEEGPIITGTGTAKEETTQQQQQVDLTLAKQKSVAFAKQKRVRFTSTNEEMSASPSSPPTTERKYIGVVKMRRKRLLEKQQLQKGESKETMDGKGDSSSNRIINNNDAAPIYKFPIVLQFLTVVLLFFAGLDVGLHPSVSHPSDALFIHNNFAPVEIGTIGFVKNFIQKKKEITTVNDDIKNGGVLFTTEAVNPPATTTGATEEEDEFCVSTLKDNEKDPILDPLFRIDLDAVVEGSGILNIFGRGAIRCHRFLVYMLYQLPLSISSLLVTLPQYPLRVPPMFAILSVSIRQGLVFFGAGLPNIDASKASERKRGKTMDVLGMVKNGAVTFIQSMFPNVIKVYQVWKHLRADMYVVLCGMFVGLAWTHHTHHTLSSAMTSRYSSGGDGGVLEEL